MEKYDYYGTMRDNIIDYIRENADQYRGFSGDALEEKLYDDLWIEDSVTGKASGSYFCNAWRAEEALCHNFDLIEEAVGELGMPNHMSPESLDVTVRCYILGQVLHEVLDDYGEELFLDAAC